MAGLRVVNTIFRQITSSGRRFCHVTCSSQVSNNTFLAQGSITRMFSTDSTDDTDKLKFGGVYTPEDMTPPIPPYIEKQGETTELKRARLLYQSRKRGMLENGLLLSTFAGKYLDSLNEQQLTDYDKLINQPTNDWEIYYWVTEAKPTPEEFQSDVMEMLKKHCKNDEKDLRIRQPDLVSH